jgi:hypothetical protein
MARSIFVASILAVSLSAPAFAITCHGNFQEVGGQVISTPYCRDNELARVARSSGFDVSDSTVRNNPARKEELCRYLNSNIQVQSACEDVLPLDGGGH